jgi:Gpi18-like mannosyltransferase
MISSPFAQFGLKGISVFNILCGLASSYFAYKIADKFGIPFPYLAIVFTFSAPIYFSVVNSGLTEPLFSLMLITCVWLIINQWYYLSAIVFSFLPYVRPECIFVLPLFMFYYLLKRKYLANILLSTGTIVISIIGFFYYKNLFWLIGQNPYATGAESQIYGNARGNLFSYLGNYCFITGTALGLLVILGILWIAGAEYFVNRIKPQKANNYFMEEILLVFGCFFNIILCHTLVWATGIHPTLGMLRFMAPLIPLASIISLRGLQLINFIPDWFKLPWLKTIIAAIFVLLVLYSPYKLWYTIPFKLDSEDVVIKNATDWLKQTPAAKKKVYYLAPYVTLCLDIDPYDTSISSALWNLNPQHPERDMLHGGIMIWDSHFGPNEGRIKLDTIMRDSNLTLLRKFEPEVKFSVIGGMDYGIWIFQKI